MSWLRKLGVVVAVSGLMVAGLAAPAAAGPAVIGAWAATDVDGSNLKLVMFEDLYTYSLDDDATVCGGGMAKIYGPAHYINRRQFVATWTVACASGGVFGPYDVTFAHLRDGGLRDSLGVTWYPTL